MSSIAGASRYLNQAKLSALQGSTVTASNILSESGIPDILSAGRNTAVSGFGISSRARMLNQQLLNNSSVNEMFSLAGGASASIESAQIQIAGLRARLPISALGDSVLGQAVDTTVEGTAAAPDTTVDETA